MCIIKRILHGRLEIRNFSSRVEKYFNTRISARPCNISYVLYLIDSTQAVIGQFCGPYSTVQPAKFDLRLRGLFIWSWLTGLTRFPRSRYTTKSECSYERVGWLGYRDHGFSNRDLGNRAESFFHMNTPSLLTGQNVFDKIPSLLKQSGQNDITLLSIYFYFRSMWFLFVGTKKVTRVDKATIVTNDSTLLRQFVFVYRILFHLTGLKFLIWTNDKIRPGNRVSSVNRAYYMKRPWETINIFWTSFSRSVLWNRDPRFYHRLSWKRNFEPA